jgi:hypothetical protein
MIGTLLTLIVYALVIGLLLWLLSYVLSAFPVPEPFRKIIWIAAVVIAVIFLIMLLLDVVGGGNMGVPRIR